MRPTGATRGRINCGSTMLITINKSNKTNYKRPQWCDAQSASAMVWCTTSAENINYRKISEALTMPIKSVGLKSVPLRNTQCEVLSLAILSKP